MRGFIVPGTDQRGAALVITLLVLIALIVVAAGLVTTSVVNTKISGTDQRRAKALDLAEAGVQEAVSRIKSGEVPGNNNPKMVAQIFLANAGSVPVLGTDSVGLGTAQPAGNWLNYTTASRNKGTLTVKYMTDASRQAIYEYDINKSIPMNTLTGMPIYEITSTGVVGNASRTVVADVCAKPFNVNMKGALASGVDVKFTGNAFSCGYNHRIDTPYDTGVNGRAGVGGCNESPQHWEVGTGDMTGIWSGGAINTGGAANRDGTPPEQGGQPGFYAGPWETLGLTQANFYSWIGAAQANVPANLDQNIYLDNDGTPQNASGNYKIGTAGSGLLYVDGDLTMNAGFTWRGLIYVEGDVKLNGSSWILGALVVKGKTKTQFNGGATILYSEDAIAQYITRNGSYATLSWREITP